MSLCREQFESRYPIPSGIHWDQSIGTYRITDISRPRNQGSIISRYEAYVHSWGVWKASREASVVATATLGGTDRPELEALLERLAAEEKSAIQRAEAFVRETGRASISALQRNFKIGYERASRLMDQLVDLGVVTPIDSEGRRSILPRAAQ